MEVVIIKLAGEHFNLTVKEHGRKGLVMSVTSNVSKMNKTIEDKGEMLSVLTHYEKYGTIVSGDSTIMRQYIKGEEANMFSYEKELIFDTGLVN